MELRRVGKAQGMKRPASLVVSVAACLFIAFSVPAAGASEIRPGHLLVGFSDEASRTTVEQTLDRADVDSVRNLGQIDTRLVRLEDDVTRAEAVSTLRRSGAVEFVEPDYRVEGALVPSDAMFGQLWGLNNTGQSVLGAPGLADADIDAPEAWNTETGLAGEVVVGISDSGIDLQHGDLVENLWSNPDEIPGNGLDDDNNGKRDDVYGWNWVSNNSNPEDDHSHGTHVAGTVAARGNNAKGVTGVSWGAKVAALKVLNDRNLGYWSDIAASILYANQEGMDIVNASLGGDGYSATLFDALSASPDTLYITAAMNNGRDIDQLKAYPCAYDLPNVLCVGATTSTDSLASFSNYGAVEVDLAAPGQTVLSTFPQSSSGEDRYEALNGTSMATPHVSGAAALLRQARPSSSVADLRRWILDGGDPLASLTGKTVTGKRLNLNGALLQAGGTPPLAPLITSAPSGPTDSAAASFSFTGEKNATFQCRLDAGSWQACNSPRDYSNLTAGSHTFRVRQTVQVGGTSEEAVQTWTIKPIPPPTIKSGPAKKTRATTASFTFSGKADTSFQCRLDSRAWAACSSPASYRKLKPGRHTFQVRQGDGQRFSQPALYPWRVIKGK